MRKIHNQSSKCSGIFTGSLIVKRDPVPGRECEKRIIKQLLVLECQLDVVLVYL
jgi:hypothetical protein